MAKALTLIPRVSEKSYALSQENVYVFQVPADSSRHNIAEAVAKQFGVTVTKVNVTNVKGKQKRTIRKGGRQVFGTRPDIKKAYVTLKDGDHIPFFASDDASADEKPAQQSKKEAK